MNMISSNFNNSLSDNLSICSYALNADKQVSWLKVKLTLCGLCLATYFSAENGYFYYCTTMVQILDIKLDAAQATSVTSVLGMCYTIGPLITAIVSLRLKPDYIILYHYVFLIGGISIIYFGQYNITMLYIGSGIFGKFCLD